jgi:hypothetical protein
MIDFMIIDLPKWSKAASSVWERHRCASHPAGCRRFARVQNRIAAWPSLLGNQEECGRALLTGRLVRIFFVSARFCRLFFSSSAQFSDERSKLQRRSCLQSSSWNFQRA